MHLILLLNAIFVAFTQKYLVRLIIEITVICIESKGDSFFLNAIVAFDLFLLNVIFVGRERKSTACVLGTLFAPENALQLQERREFSSENLLQSEFAVIYPLECN